MADSKGTGGAGLCPELASLLEDELNAGNAIRETGHAPGSDGTLVLLTRSFLVQPHALPPEVSLVPVNDPHWWKSEYRCKLHPHVLACPFD